MTDRSEPKIPVSVLVVIHDGAGRVLLLERADRPGFWQSVTGSLDRMDEAPRAAAAREVFEETGIDVGSLPTGALVDWNRQTVYEIYEHWRHRYGEGVTHNTEHAFGLQVPSGTIPVLAEREHLRYQWLDTESAAQKCFSPSNAEVIRLLDHEPAVLRVGTYNIHKGVRGVGPLTRLEVHNLSHGIAALDADLVFLQEVRSFHHGHAHRFRNHVIGWPPEGQAEFLAPKGYEVAYRSNAITRHGEHGNALLARWPILDIGHHGVSDHRFEQRGLLHAVVQWRRHRVHALVAHLGLMHGSRVRQVERIGRYIEAHVPRHEPVVLAGDFNDWGERLDHPMRDLGLSRARATDAPSERTFPSAMPLFSLDRIYTRSFTCRASHVPRGSAWSRMSDHLPLVSELCLQPSVSGASHD